MASTNTFVDEHIAIEYPVDFQLNVQSGFSYSLSRGNQLHLIDLLSREDWNWHKESALTHAKPEFTPDHVQAPTNTTQIRPFRFEDWHGESLWRELTSPKGKLLMKGAFFFLEDESRTVHVRIDDTQNFTEDLVQSFLSGISFPGQAKYKVAAASSQVALEFDSPYAIKLCHFTSFGAFEAKDSEKYNVTYSGESIDNKQSEALDNFVENEKAISKAVRNRVHVYYKKEELPALQGIIPAELLPQVTGPEDFLQHITLAGIHVHSARPNGDVPIGLSFDASWTENDVGVRTVGSSIEAAGTAYVALESE